MCRRYGEKESMKLKLSLILFLSILWATPSFASLVTNGTFDNDCAGWTLAQTDGFTCSSTEGNPGFALILNNVPGPVPQASQDIGGLVIGVAYEITLDAKTHYNCCNSPSTPGAGVAIDGNQFDFLILDNQPWTTYTFDFTYAGGSKTLVLSAQRNGTDSDGEFDNVAISPSSPGVPEPGVSVLLGSGIAALLGLRLKKR
jgi:hypothetical protein